MVTKLIRSSLDREVFRVLENEILVFLMSARELKNCGMEIGLSEYVVWISQRCPRLNLNLLIWEYTHTYVHVCVCVYIPGECQSCVT